MSTYYDTNQYDDYYDDPFCEYCDSDPCMCDDPDDYEVFYSDTCDTPGCIIFGAHFRSECETVRDVAEYESAFHDVPIPWRLREPFYTLNLLWNVLRYRDEAARREWRFHVDCELPSIRDLLPRKCFDCGRRWRKCKDDCLPF